MGRTLELSLSPRLLILVAFAIPALAADQAKKPAAAAKPAPVVAPVVAPCPAPAPAGPTEAQKRDEALLIAIQRAYEPAPDEIRALAVEELGLLGDPRALNILSYFAIDGSQTVQLSAVKALRSIQHPRSEEILSNVVRHPKPADATKLAALDALAFQRTASATTLVQSIRDDARYSDKLRSAAKELLTRIGAP